VGGALAAGDPFHPSQAILAPPSGGHLLGTDELGRDVFSRLLHGAGTSLFVAVASVLPATLFGTALGVTSGYTGRLLDDVILKSAELFQIIPNFLLALVAGALFGPNLLLVVVVLNITFWPYAARIARGETLAVRERGFVEAARALGVREARIVTRHVVPGVLPPVIVNASFQAGVAMLIEAGLAFLGVGDPNRVSWGQMLADAQGYVGVAWWLYVFPGAALSLAVLGMNLTGDGLNQIWQRSSVMMLKVGRIKAVLFSSRTPGRDLGALTTPVRPLLEVRGLTTRFDENGAGDPAIEDVSFCVETGRRFGIVGESGSGKTVTALSIMGLIDPPGHIAAGEILFRGKELRGLPRAEYQKVRGAQIAMISQDPLSSLNPVMRVGAQLVETMMVHRSLDRNDARELAVDLLAEVGLDRPRQRLDTYPHELSGGMRQRVAIALALCCQPQLLIADEPTTALDVTIQAQILDLLTRLTDERGTAVVLITHDLGVIAGFAQQIAVMKAGRIVEQENVEAAFAHPTHPYTRSLMGAARQSQLVAPRAQPPASPGDAGFAGHTEILRVTGLTKHFPVTSGRVLRRKVGSIHAVDDLSIVVHRGETVALVGESGCGKSTTIRAILRLVEPTRGTVIFDGQDVGAAGRQQLRALRSGMQLVSQDPSSSLNPRLRVGAILAEALELRGLDNDHERITQLLQEVRLLPEHAARRPGELSGGQRQRVAIARALASRPNLILCDEPVSSLDAPIRRQILDLLAELQQELGLSYVMVSHDLTVIREVAHKAAVMYLGQIVELADTTSLYGGARHPYTVALLSAVPIPDPAYERRRLRVVLGGEPPSPTQPPPACRFHTRCWKAEDVCRTAQPPLVELAPGHWVACHYPEPAVSVKIGPRPGSQEGAVT